MSFASVESFEKAAQNKKAPEVRGLLVEFKQSLTGRRSYFFFLGAAFFLAGAFLVAFFIDLILPNVNNLRSKNRNVIHI